MVNVGEETSTAATFSPVETWPMSMVVSSEAEASSFLKSVQQSHLGSQFVFWQFNLQIELEIGVQMRRTVIPHLKPILNTSKLKIEIETKWYIFLSVKQLPQIARLKRKLR